jgi:hypothetical protein
MYLLLPENKILNPTIIEPNFLLDILSRFILIASLFYILYKFYLVPLTEEIIINYANEHIKFYTDRINGLIQNSFIKKIIIANLYYYFTLYTSNDSIPNTSTNDKNFMIIYLSMIIGISVLISAIIILTGGINKINYLNLGISFLVNITIITITQLMFFYLVYIYLDPISFYKIFYYNYLDSSLSDSTSSIIQPDSNSSSNTTSDSNLSNNLINKITDIKSKGEKVYQISSEVARTIINAGIDIKLQTGNLTNNLTNNSSERESIINSKSTTVIYVFMIISVILFIIFGIITILNVLVIYKNFNMPYAVIPLNNITIIVYSTLTLIFLFVFIILLMLLTSRI